MVVTIQLHLLIFTKFQLLKELFNSTFALDRATTLCFLLFQDTRFPPRNTQHPMVDLVNGNQPNLHHNILGLEYFPCSHTTIPVLGFVLHT